MTIPDGVSGERGTQLGKHRFLTCKLKSTSYIQAAESSEAHVQINTLHSQVLIIYQYTRVKLTRFITQIIYLTCLRRRFDPPVYQSLINGLMSLICIN